MIVYILFHFYSVGVGATTVSSVCTTPPPCVPTQSSTLGATVTKKPVVSSSEMKLCIDAIASLPMKTSADAGLSQIPLQRSSTFNSIPLELEANLKSVWSETELPISCLLESSAAIAPIQSKLQRKSGAEIKQVSPENHLMTSSPLESIADIDLDQAQRKIVSGKKRLRSVSLEKLDVLQPKKQLLQVSTGRTDIADVPGAFRQATTVHTYISNDAGQNHQVERRTRDTRVPISINNGENSKNILRCENFLSTFYAKKVFILDVTKISLNVFFSFSMAPPQLLSL